ASPAEPAGSTTPRPGTPAPSWGAWQPTGSAGRGLFFTRVRRVGAGDPLLRPLPPAPETLDRLPNRLVGQPPRGQPLLEGHIGQQAQRPGAPGLAEVAWALVEDAPEWVGLRLIEHGPGVLRPVLLLGQAGDPFAGERADRVVDRPDGAPDPGGDGGRALPVGAGQEDLGAAEWERLAAAEAGPECPALGVGQRSNEQGWFHDPLFGPSHRLTRNLLRLH